MVVEQPGHACNFISSVALSLILPNGCCLVSEKGHRSDALFILKSGNPHLNSEFR